jgi:hypothetical protein
MTDSAQAELVYHVVMMASNLHRRKLRLHGANIMPYIDRGLVLYARQKLKFHKFRTGNFTI